MNEGAYRQECLRSFPCFEVRGSSAHGDKILFFEIFHCSLIKTIHLN